MDSIDAKVFALMALGTLAAVGALKKAWSAWANGKEEFLAVVLPAAFVIVAKLSGALKATDWVNALVLAIAAGLVSGVIHDKVLNPVIKGAKSLTGKSP